MAAVSSNILKNVVVQAMNEQCKSEINESIIVIYGFPEDNNDYNELLDMFDFLKCRCDIVRHMRMGKLINDKRSKGRPLKVKLRSISTVNSIMSQTKYLRYELYFAGVNNSRWLS